MCRHCVVLVCRCLPFAETNILYFPVLVLKGIYHYRILFFQGTSAKGGCSSYKNGPLPRGVVKLRAIGRWAMQLELHTAVHPTSLVDEGRNPFDLQNPGKFGYGSVPERKHGETLVDRPHSSAFLAWKPIKPWAPLGNLCTFGEGKSRNPGKALIIRGHRKPFGSYTNALPCSFCTSNEGRSPATHKHMHKHPHPHTHTYTHTHIHTHIHTQIHTHTQHITHRHTHTHVHTDTPTHTHTNPETQLFFLRTPSLRSTLPLTSPDPATASAAAAEEGDQFAGC